MRRFFAVLLVSVCSTVVLAATTAAPRYIDIPFVSVYDGDTVDVRMVQLPAPLDRVRIRISGIDTPELGVRSRCAYENTLAVAARGRLRELVAPTGMVRVYHYRWDKYGGRIGGYIMFNGENVGDVLVREGFAVKYAGVGVRKDWCASDPKKEAGEVPALSASGAVSSVRH